jgi:hypothetical protein
MVRASPAWRPAKGYNPTPVPDLSRSDARDEENLLIEAISLLVQRQGETESLVAEQVFHAEERAAVTERHYAELEARLTGIEDQLGRLIRELDYGQADPAVDERMARLREQIEGLRAGPDGRPPGTTGRAGQPALDTAPAAANTREPVSAHRPATTTEPTNARELLSGRASMSEPRPRRPGYAATAEPRGLSFWDAVGATAQERFGLVLIVVGALAVIYAILSQLPLR